MKTQGQLKDEITNRVRNEGIFIQEKTTDYEGHEIIVYLVLPRVLAEKADVVADVIVYDHKEKETEEQPEVKEPEVKKPEAKKKPAVVPKKKAKTK